MASESQLTVGGLVDALVKAAQAETNPAIGLTQFIEKVGRDANLSPRNISRIRDSSDFPESDAVLKLANAIPQVSILDTRDIANRLLWDWENVEYDQKTLLQEKQNGHSLTIFSGWQAPIALQCEDVVKSIARNIREGFTYTFIYPSPAIYPKDNGDIKSTTERWIQELRDKVSGAWIYDEMNKSEPNIDRTQLTERMNSFLEELDSTVQLDYTEADSTIWMDLPSNYCIFYNLGLVRNDNKFRYGSFRVSGQIMKPTNQREISAIGWLYTTQKQYELIEAGFKKIPDWHKLIHKSFKSEMQ
jgi:hypothetical protein